MLTTPIVAALALLSPLGSPASGPSAGSQGKTYTLRHVIAVDDTQFIEVSGTIQFPGQVLEIVSTSIDKILKVNSDGSYTVEHSLRDQATRLFTLPITSQSKPTTSNTPDTITVVDYNADGSIKAAKGVSPFGRRFANLLVMRVPKAPVGMSQRWTVAIPANAATGEASAKATYEVEGLEKIVGHESVKVSFKVIEDGGDKPPTSEGFLWLETEKFSLMKADCSFKNVKFPGFEGLVSGTLKVDRRR